MQKLAQQPCEVRVFPFGISRQNASFPRLVCQNNVLNPLLRKGKIPSTTRESNSAPLEYQSATWPLASTIILKTYQNLPDTLKFSLKKRLFGFFYYKKGLVEIGV
jgi:hypothetical protein